jgi:hypothetical protein
MFFTVIGNWLIREIHRQANPFLSLTIKVIWIGRYGIKSINSGM